MAGNGEGKISYAAVVQAASTSWRLLRRSRRGGEGQRELRIATIPQELADKVLSNERPGFACIRSQPLAKGSSQIYLSYKAKSTVHHVEVAGLSAAWKAGRKGSEFQCILPSAGIALVSSITEKLLPLIFRVVSEISAHRHFVDRDIAGVCLDLEMRFREFVICRNGHDSFLVCAMNGEGVVNSATISVEPANCCLVCRDVEGAREISGLDDVLSRLVGRDTSLDLATTLPGGEESRSLDGAVTSSGHAIAGQNGEAPAEGHRVSVVSRGESIARVRVAVEGGDALDLRAAISGMFHDLVNADEKERSIWLKLGALEPVVHALCTRGMGNSVGGDGTTIDGDDDGDGDGERDELSRVVGMLISDNHESSRKAASIVTAKIEMCMDDTNQLKRSLEALDVMLDYQSMRRAVARSQDSLRILHQAHSRHSVSKMCRIDGTRDIPSVNASGRHQDEQMIMTNRSETSFHGISFTHRSDADAAATGLFQGGTGSMDALVSPRAMMPVLPFPRLSSSSAGGYTSMSARFAAGSPRMQMIEASPRGTSEELADTPRSGPNTPRLAPLETSPRRRKSEDGGDSGRESGEEETSAARGQSTSGVPKLMLRTLSVPDSPMQSRSSRRSMSLSVRLIHGDIFTVGSPGPRMSDRIDSQRRIESDRADSPANMRSLKSPHSAENLSRRTTVAADFSHRDSERVDSEIPMDEEEQSADKVLSDMALVISHTCVASVMAAITAQRAQIPMASQGRSQTPAAAARRIRGRGSGRGSRCQYL